MRAKIQFILAAYVQKMGQFLRPRTLSMGSIKSNSWVFLPGFILYKICTSVFLIVKKVDSAVWIVRFGGAGSRWVALGGRQKTEAAGGLQ